MPRWLVRFLVSMHQWNDTCSMTVICQHWTSFGAHGTCALGRFGGRPSLGTCRLVCQLGTAPYTEPVPGNRAEALLPPLAVATPAPTWDELRAQIAAAWPDWLPEFDTAQAALVGCTTCVDTARRQRWAQRLAALAPAVVSSDPPSALRLPSSSASVSSVLSVSSVVSASPETAP